MKKSLHDESTPKFAQVKGNFINSNDRFKLEKSFLSSHLNYHVCCHKLLILKHHRLFIVYGTLLTAAVLRHISTIQKKKEWIPLKLRTIN